MNEQSAERSPKHPAPYRGLPVMFIAADPPIPAPFLINPDELIRLSRLHHSRTKFPAKTTQRYRRVELRSARIGRRIWFRLDDVLRFLDQQQEQFDRQE